MEPRFLILETSGRAGQVGLAVGEDLRSVQPLDEARRHARDLAPTVAGLLSAAGWRPRDIDAVLVSRGPGSYTGLRVGVMSAKAFAYATGCTLLAVDTFLAIALQAPRNVLRLDVLGDAQQGSLYVQPFARHTVGGALEAREPLTIRPLQEWLASLDPATWVTGPGLRLAVPHLPAFTQQVDAAHWDPRADSVLQAGLARYRAGERDEVWAVEPLYLRASSAELRWQQRQQQAAP